jgi:hypothetical protein
MLPRKPDCDDRSVVRVFRAQHARNSVAIDPLEEMADATAAVHCGAWRGDGVAGGGAAQQSQRMRRIGVLMWGGENDPMVKTQVFALTQSLADLGWTDGRNVQIDLRSGGADANRIQALAKELVTLQPDIIVTSTTLAIPSSGRRGRSRSSL